MQQGLQNKGAAKGQGQDAINKKIGDVTKKRSNSGSPTLRYVNIKRARTFQLIILKLSGHCNN